MKKIGNTIFFFFLILFYLLGYTNILGGPFGLGKFLFIITLIGVFIGLIFFWKISKLAQKISKPEVKKDETINVESKIVE